MEMQVFDKPRLEKRIPKYYKIPVESRKKGIKPKDFFFIGNDRKVISLLLHNFDSGFCSEDLQKGFQIIKMLVTRKISLPDVIIIQHGYLTKDLDNFFASLPGQIHSIPVIIEGTNAPIASIEQFRSNRFVDDVFVLDQSTVNQF